MKKPVQRIAATYERVSSEDQKERGTIETQAGEIARTLAEDPEIELLGRFIDDGVSGTIPLALRPAGHRLMQAAEAGLFTELWIYNIKRLGRDAVDLLPIRRWLQDRGIRLISVVEGEPDLLAFDIHAVFGDNDRRTFLKLTAAGMDRAAREGRYCGGVISYGFRVEMVGRHPYLVEDDRIVWGDLSAADVVRMVFRMSGQEGKTCRQIAAQLNQMAIPTSYAKDGRGVRGKRTQGTWRQGRIGQLLNNAAYRGELHYGKRTDKKEREIIIAECPRLVSDELWAAAQTTLNANSLIPKNTKRRYLLRSVIKCGLCGLAYVGSTGEPGVWWYRCNGQLVERGHQGRCPAKALRNTDVEPLVWGDIDQLLRNPGDILDELAAQTSIGLDDQAAVVEAQRVTFETALADLEPRRQRNLSLYERGKLSDKEVDERLDQIESERRAVEAALSSLQVVHRPEAPIDGDLLEAIAQCLDDGLSDEQRQEIVQLLVRQITVYTTVFEDGHKEVKLVIEYRFSTPDCSLNCTGTDSWPRGA